MQSFIQCKNGDIPAQNNWYRDCRKANVPFVYVELKTKYASLTWDCITVDPRQEHCITDQEDQIGEEILSVFHKFKEPRRSRLGQSTVFTGTIHDLTPMNAGLAAAQIYEILNSRLPVNM